MDENIQEVHHRPSGLRRAFTMKNNVARQVAVNFVPSKQGYNTLRRAHSEHDALLQDVDTSEHQANIIVREMEQHDQLMEDNPEAEELRREALRDLPQCLTTKRHVRAKLSASVSSRSKRRPLSMWKRLSYRIGFAWKRSKDRMRNLIFTISPWYEAIRIIEGNFGSAVGTYFYFLRWIVMFNVVFSILLISFLVVPQALHNSFSNSTRGVSGVLDFISGKGILEDSLLFYGHYHTGDINTATPDSRYNMAFAYFFTMIISYFVYFGVLCYRTAYCYRRTFIETDENRHAFANKVFSGWDFGIATEQAAVTNHNSIYNELKELLAEQNKNKVELSRCTKISQYIWNITVSVLVLALIAAVGCGFWFFLGVEQATEKYWEIVVSLTATAVFIICPVLFNAVVKLEFYTPRMALYVTLLRTCLLDFGTLFIVLLYWSISNTACWETSIGQETYRLVLLDAFFSLILLPSIEFIRGLVYKCNEAGVPPEFNITYNSLTLIYNQAILWLGMIFSPLLVVAVTIKFILLFYVKREVATRACWPARNVWRAAHTQTIMYMLVTLSLFITMFAIGSLYISSTSSTCGPFRRFSPVYAVLTQGVLHLSDRPRLRAILAMLTRPGVIGFVMLLLGILVYYARAKSQAQRSMVEILRQMLVIEAKDKDFLLSAIAKVTNGEWQYCPRIEDSEPDSYTWRYLHDDKVKKPSNAGFAFDSSRLNHSVVDSRPKSYHGKERNSNIRVNDGDSDSSFSWRGSNEVNTNVEKGRGDWI